MPEPAYCERHPRPYLAYPEFEDRVLHCGMSESMRNVALEALTKWRDIGHIAESLRSTTIIEGLKEARVTHEPNAYSGQVEPRYHISMKISDCRILAYATLTYLERNTVDMEEGRLTRVKRGCLAMLDYVPTQAIQRDRQIQEQDSYSEEEYA